MGARIHWPGYAKIIRLMIDKPVSWVEVCAGIGIDRRESAHRILYGFKDAGLAYIIDWDIDRGDARSRRPVFAWGKGEDVPWPAGERRRKHRVAPPDLLALIVAIRALMDEPQQGKGLSMKTGNVPKTARNMLRELRAQRLIYIDHFQDRGAIGAGYPFYAWGPGLPDAIKPRRQPYKVGYAKNNRNQKIRNATVNLLHAMAGSTTRSARTLAHSAEVLATA